MKDSGCGVDSAVCYRDDSTSSEDSRGQYTASTKLSASEGLESVSLSYSGGERGGNGGGAGGERRQRLKGGGFRALHFRTLEPTYGYRTVS